jgi:hypothetical protein
VAICQRADPATFATSENVAPAARSREAGSVGAILRPDLAEALMSDWIIHPDGGKLGLFRRREGLLASRNEAPDVLRLFVVQGFETNPDITAARDYLRRGGRTSQELETCGKDFIAEIHATAAVADDRIRPCYLDYSIFWSRSRSNRMCVYCKIDDGDWEW